MDKQIAHIAKLIGDPTRAVILVALMAGRALTAGELAIRAHISPQTASNHLKKLLEAKLIQHIDTPSRYRYYQIASPLVAQALESLSLLSAEPKQAPPRHERIDKALCAARTCYDHLAGALGVQIAQALQRKGYVRQVEQVFEVTDQGHAFFATFEINCEQLQKQRREFAKACLDWTEREYHVAGSLGKAILIFMLEQRLIRQSKQKPRVIVVTEQGKRWLRERLGIS